MALADGLVGDKERRFYVGTGHVHLILATTTCSPAVSPETISI